MKYRIQIDCPRQNVRSEYFVEFVTNGYGQTLLRTDKTQCHWFSGAHAIDSARDHLRELQRKFRDCTARLIDEHGNCQAESDLTPDSQPLNLYNSHEEIVHRRRLEDGRLIEALLVRNKSTRKYYLKFTMNQDQTAPFDQSIGGDSPDQVFEHFWNNPGIPQYVKTRYIVDESFLHQRPAEPVASPGAPIAQLPDGTRISVRLTS